MRLSTLVRLAISGSRTDAIRFAMTAFGSAAAVFCWLCAATVASLGVSTTGRYIDSRTSTDLRYSTDLIAQPGLRPGVIATFTLLTIPVLALVAQCARLGAPARDRRIAAMRLAGATPQQAVAIGAGESSAAAALGSIAGLAVYFVLRTVLGRPDQSGQRSLPTDILPPAWAIAALCLSLPLLVGLVSARLLRRVTTTPLGVVRQVRRRRAPGPWAGLFIGLAIAIFAGLRPAARLLSHHHINIPGAVAVIALYVGMLAGAAGVALSAGWLAYTAGRLLRRFGRHAPGQLAAGRLLQDPWQGSRTFGVLAVATLFGAATAGVYVNFVAGFDVEDASTRQFDLANNQEYAPTDHSFYTNVIVLVAIAIGLAIGVAALGQLISVSDAIVSRRRTYAALVATGVPRGVLARMTVWQTMIVAIPAVTLASAAGVLIARALMGTTVSADSQTSSIVNGVEVGGVSFTRAVPIPWPQLGLLESGALATVLLTVGIGLLFLKASTSIEELRTG